MFQSTHPARGATTNSGDYSASSGVSIHAPRAGCDSGNYKSIIFEWLHHHFR